MIRLPFLAAALLVLIVLASPGCSTIASGVGNLTGATTTTPTTQAEATSSPVERYEGNTGRLEQNKKSTPRQIEQALAQDILAKTQSLKFSIEARDESLIDARTRRVLDACDSVEKNLSGNDSIRSSQIKSAIKLLRRGAPEQNISDLRDAIRFLHAVRGA